jgi:hypothetical protein
MEDNRNNDFIPSERLICMTGTFIYCLWRMTATPYDRLRQAQLRQDD